MPTPEIIQRARDLHAELGDTQPSPASESHIEPIKQHLDKVLAEPEHLPHYTSLRDKLLFAYVGFEIDHPKLAGAMQDLINALDAAGL